MGIWAKSSGVTLIEHTQHLLDAIDKLPYEKLKISNIDKGYIQELLRWACLFHDLGKVSPKFQERMGNTNFPLQIFDFPDIRHNILSLFFINKDKVEKLCKEDENLYATFLSSIVFHHWKQDEKEYLLGINEDLIKASKLLLKNNNGEELAKTLREHFDDFKIKAHEAKEFISFDEHIANQIAKRGNLLSVNILPPYTLYFLPERLIAEEQKKINLNLWIFLSGFLIRVDHFASMVERQEYKGITWGEVEKLPKEFGMGEILEEKFGKDFWQKEAKDFKEKNLILIAPTGIGKTEFAFLWAEGEKFFYTLPLRVATNQIFDRACIYFNKKKVDSEDPFINGNVGLMHCDADLYLFERWENFKKDLDGETPKILDLAKHFSLPVNILTGDQIFPAGLKYPQYEKVYATLGYSKLIIDEVQAYDPKACAIVVKMIEDIVSLGGKFLLMTATLPGFVKEYLKIISDIEVIDFYSKLSDITRHKIDLREKDVIDDANEIIEKARGGKRILIVLNTVVKAEEVFNKLKNEAEKNNIFCGLLHSRFTLNQKKEIEKKLEIEFKNPKPPDENVPKILVATQVLEASLDVDADYLFTEIAPTDSLVQRMGRVMRRVNLLSGKIKGSSVDFKYENIYKDSEPNVFVYCQKNEEKILESGKGKVYKQELLKKTYDVLNGKKEIKEKDKQSLVEDTYRDLENSNYLEDFYETISILNSGYVSENKEEAQSLFREIFSISLIEEDKIKKIAEKIKNEIQNNSDINWLWFKKEIIAEYVINDNLWKYRDSGLKTFWEELKQYLNADNKIKKKLKNYCESIFVFKEVPNEKINKDVIIL